jgi:hypothetical protein
VYTSDRASSCNGWFQKFRGLIVPAPPLGATPTSQANVVPPR